MVWNAETNLNDFSKDRPCMTNSAAVSNSSFLYHIRDLEKIKAWKVLEY
jgi:hypothetical protein